MMHVPLTRDTIDKEDIDELIEWLKEFPKLTKGPVTLEFENKWSRWMGVKHSVFFNSGSSSNLAMVYALIVSGRLKNKKIVVPALSWLTTVSPGIQLGLETILVDCNLNDLSVDLQHLSEIFIKEQPSILMMVSVLGLVPEMDKIVELCETHGVALLEDSCETLGSRHNGRLLGTFGLMSSFSTYFSHTISTIEGGIVVTQDAELSNLLKMIRSHGWDRDVDSNFQSQLRQKWNVDEFNALYKFYLPGFNLRSTDLQAKIGLGQLDKLNNIVKIREENYQTYMRLLSDDIWKPKLPENSFASNFCFPIIHKNRDKIIKALQDGGVEVRPLVSGSQGMQPYWIDLYGECQLPNVSIVDKHGFYIPNNHMMNEENSIKYICDIINSNLD